MIETDFLIIGSGAAGLTLAIKLGNAFSNKTVTVVTKANRSESNTKYAQGGVAAVFDLEGDSFQKHINDTLIAGDGLCDEAIVELVVTEGPERLRELMDWGANFDIDESGKLSLGKEGGHSEYRVVHHKDSTGNEIERSLLAKLEHYENIRLLPHHFAIDLITEHHFGIKNSEQISCYGAYVMDQVSGKILTIKASNTTLASGGLGRIYGHTTNPAVATGDGIAMAYRAKARIKNMEFIQFHPTALYDGKNDASFLISEAVRGHGAFLRNQAGERFMLHYDARGELASRDIVARAIDSEMKRTGDKCVYLDCTHLDTADFQFHFPQIYNTCAERGFDLSKDWIPVVPAAHYLCGGVEVDAHGRTSIQNLFACGECSHTGLHGANRLASNSLLEALVFAHEIYKCLCTEIPSPLTKTPPLWNDNEVVKLNSLEVIVEKTAALQSLMRNYVGVVRNNKDLQFASDELHKIYLEVEDLYQRYKMNTDLAELRNMVNVAYMIIEQSLARTENRGGYFNEDYSKKHIKFTV